VLKIKDLIQNRENLLFGKNMRELFRSFRTDNNVVGPIVAENFIEKEFKRIAGNIDITVANAGLNSMMKKLFEFICGDLNGRFFRELFKLP
jgi:hypothetical protein